MNFLRAEHSEWSEFQNLPTPNFVHCLLEWATLEIRYFRLFRDLVNCFSYDLIFWILRIRTFQFEVSPVERGILPGETVHEAPLVTTGKISESAVSFSACL